MLLLFSHQVMSDSLWPHGLQHARLLCPSASPGIFSNSCPLSRWCHPNISSSVSLFSFYPPFSSCPQSFPESGSFPVSQLFTSGGHSIGASALASVLLMKIQGWFPLRLTGWISLQSKGLSRVLSNTTVQQHRFVGSQPSLWSSSHICTGSRKNRSLTIWTFIDKAMCSLRNALEFQVNRKEMLLSSPQQETVIWEHRSRRVHTRSWSHAGFCDVSSAHFTSFSDN